MPDISKIVAYESGTMNDDEMIEFFQGMINSGVVWQLQGSYGRTAAYLIDTGYCEDPNHTRS